MTEEITSYHIVADFVNTYEERIKPNLKKGVEQLENIKFLLLEQVVRGEDVITHKLPSMEERGAYGRYRLVLHWVGGLSQAKELSNELFDWSAETIERYVEELDLILLENSHYKELRRQTE